MRRSLYMVASVLVVMVLAAGSVLAVEVAATYQARTGDGKLDRSLAQLNVRATSDWEDFAMRLVGAYSVPRAKVEELRTTYRMVPADIYMTVKLGWITTKPVNVVLEQYKANQGKGWGVIAKQLGIKPGSKEFHQMKADQAGLLGKGKGKEKKEKGGKGKGKGKDKD